jgi:hypothetical protein
MAWDYLGKMRLAPQGIGPGKVYVSDEFRKEMDAWMRDFFGVHEDIRVDLETGHRTVQCRSCERQYELPCDPEEFDQDMSYCGGSDRCLP